ncbi:hypothetical protein PWT90_06153 [Aphanocladium album]|nr:hypothetical protein PWT90_06153 [Aphanocladium album]
MAALLLAGSATADFSCIKPVNPIPAGPPGSCCEELNQSFLLKFLYTGKDCLKATKLSEDKDGKTTYANCPSGTKQACCDPLLTQLNHKVNPACVLPL